MATGLSIGAGLSGALGLATSALRMTWPVSESCIAEIEDVHGPNVVDEDGHATDQRFGPLWPCPQYVGNQAPSALFGFAGNASATVMAGLAGHHGAEVLAFRDLERGRAPRNTAAPMVVGIVLVGAGAVSWVLSTFPARSRMHGWDSGCETDIECFRRGYTGRVGWVQASWSTLGVGAALVGFAGSYDDARTRHEHARALRATIAASNTQLAVSVSGRF